MKAQNLLPNSTATFLDMTRSIREGDLPPAESYIFDQHLRDSPHYSLFPLKVSSERGQGKVFPVSMALGVNKRHCDITGSFGGWKTFMVVGESSWMHESPPFPWSSN